MQQEGSQYTVCRTDRYGIGILFPHPLSISLLIIQHMPHRSSVPIFEIMTHEELPVHEKYAAEAQKRLRPDGLSQFQNVQQSDSFRLRRFAQDIWLGHDKLDSESLAKPILNNGEKVKFLITGAGIGGIVSAVRLILAGFSADQIRLVETAGGVGGTWYWNRFPGLHCDVESYVYMPLLEEMGYMPSKKYASGVEIREYLNQVVQRYQLQDKIMFRTKLEQLEWDEQSNIWRATLNTTTSGAEGKTDLAVEAEFAILTSGYLHQPQVPKLDGSKSLDVFEGDMFHTARWDYGVTGGSGDQEFPPLEKLRSKKVGIIGTGATAIQAVPHLAEYAEELFVFQRTPSAVFARDQRTTDPIEWKASIASSHGWQKARMENMTAIMSKSAPPGAVDLVNDEWTRQLAYSGLTGDPEWPNLGPEGIPRLISYFLDLDSEPRARLRARVSETVDDEATAAGLTPWYPVWCKRPTFSDTYLQTFNKPHVHLVDTDGHGISGTTSSGIISDGIEYKLDVLVLATGYVSPAVTGGDPSARAGVRVYGRGGMLMSDKFEDQGLTTLHGVSTSGFPNLFWLGASQGAAAANLTHVLDTQSRHIAYIVASAHKTARADGRVVVEVGVDAEQAWSMRVAQNANRLAITSVCTPGYLNNEGQALRMSLGLGDAVSLESMMKKARMAPWSAGMTAYLHELKKWRDEGGLNGFRMGSE